MTERLLETLANDAMSRLRWLVTRQLCLSPQAELSDDACLWAAGNMVLDLRRAAGTGGGANPSFDTEKFEELKEGRL
ncbi:MAG: hypothetical protein RR314_04720 [Oscillospiraceae bacterium]